jgi:flagellar motor switch protein FliG
MAERRADTTGPGGTKKAAMFLLGMGPEFARSVFAHLPDHEIRLLAEHAAQLGTTHRDDVLEVLRDFVEEFLGGPMTNVGGASSFQQLVNRALGTSRAMGILAGRNQKNPISEVCDILSAPLLDRLLRREHPQTQAIILASVTPEQATAVLEARPEEESADLVFRIGHLDAVSTEALQGIADALEQEILRMGSSDEQETSLDPMKIAADVTANLPGEYSLKVLARLDETDEVFANDLRSRLFVFTDLLRLDTRTMQIILRDVDKADLVVALRGADAEVRQHFFGNMSVRAAEMMKDDIQSMGPVRVSDVENAQKEIVAVALRLEKEGTLTLPRGDGDELV